jgi:predicted DNA-binding protein (UPF0278 family)
MKYYYGVKKHPAIYVSFFPFGISNVLCKVSLISLIDFTDGGCIADTICACLDFIVLVKNREQNLEKIRQQRQIFHDQVKQMRAKINSHLDTLEQNILKELDDAEDKIKSKIISRIDKSPTQSLWFVEIQSGQHGISWT